MRLERVQRFRARRAGTCRKASARAVSRDAGLPFPSCRMPLREVAEGVHSFPEYLGARLSADRASKTGKAERYSISHACGR